MKNNREDLPCDYYKNCQFFAKSADKTMCSALKDVYCIRESGKVCSFYKKKEESDK